MPYNTGLKRDDESLFRQGLEEIAFAQTARGVVFAHAVEVPLSEAERALVAKAELLYSELPWQKGWSVFHDRAGIAPAGSYESYLAAVKRLIVDLGKPAYIVCSRAAAFALTQYPVCRVKLNGDPAWLAIRGGRLGDISPGCETTGELIAGLAQKYSAVYDFSCGYGNSLRPFRYSIGSDIDRKCLAHVALEILRASPPEPAPRE